MLRKRKTNKRAPVTREAVIDAALEIADERGFDALTMRSLATVVGVPPMTLYGRVSDKSELYAGMRDRLAAKYLVASTAETWQELLDQVARNFYDVFRKHPNWIPLFGSGTSPPAPAIAYLGRLITLMLADGISIEHAFHSHASSLSLAFGAAHIERLFMGPSHLPAAARRLALLQEIIPRLPEDRRPTLPTIAAQLDTVAFEGVFDFGLRAIIDAVEARRPPPNHE